MNGIQPAPKLVTCLKCFKIVPAVVMNIRHHTEFYCPECKTYIGFTPNDWSKSVWRNNP